MATKTSLRNDISNYIFLRLGSGMVDVELDPEHITVAIDKAIQRYRQRAENSTESSYLFLTTEENKQEYILPDEVEVVRQIFRRSVGSGASDTGSMFDPFEAAYVNTYMLQAGKTGGQTTYELYTQYQELNARMFGGYIMFDWNPASKTITLQRNLRSSGEEMLLWVYNIRPELSLLQDRQVQPWIQDYSLAMAKYMLGEARSKFSTIAGPSGGTTLNGDTLKAEAQQEMDKLDEELKNYVDRSNPLTFIIG